MGQHLAGLFGSVARPGQYLAGPHPRVFDGRQAASVNRLGDQCTGNTKIQRHIKIKQDANPYDAEWELYFEQRITRKFKQDLRGTPRTLWFWQKGICPECNERLDLHRSWEVHHVVYRCHGGPDTIDNLMLLHPNCHRHLNSRDSAGQSPAGENLTRA